LDAAIVAILSLPCLGGYVGGHWSRSGCRIYIAASKAIARPSDPMDG